MVLKQIDDFLTLEECTQVIKMIEDSSFRSRVSTNSGDVYEESRTSSTCNLSMVDPIVKKIAEKIANEVGRPLEFMENLQGQKYEPGQYFRPHNDWFGQGTPYNSNCLHSGQRTETLMIYLNENFEGGKTNFPKIQYQGIPKTGRAVYWTNMKDGKGDSDAMHEGSDVTSGVKYIITSWWRENEWNGAEDKKLYQESLKPKEETLTVVKNDKTYSNVETLPKFTEKGYLKMKMPDDVWELVQEMYQKVKESLSEEKFAGKEGIILGEGNTSDIMSLEAVPHLKVKLHQMLLPIHKAWANTNLEPTFIYGIRSYNKGATLKQHVDRIATHHISSILMVDKDLTCGCKNKKYGEDWALQIQGHDGKWESVYLEPGEMILYESAKCSHGRDLPFEGKYFRNMYVHYKLSDYTYEG